MAVLVAVAVHATVEFQLRTPGVFLTLCAVLALALSALRLERRRQGERLNAKKVRIRWNPAGVLPVVLIGGFIILNGAWALRHFVAEAYCNTVPNSTLNRDPLPEVSEIEKAIAWDSGNAAYRYKLALALIRERDGSPAQALGASAPEWQRRIVDALEAAVERNPMEAAYHVRLGWEYTRLWKQPDYHDRWLPAADLSMERAAYVAGKKNASLHEEIGNYWVMRSKVLSPADERWHSAQRRGSWHYRTALAGSYGRRAREIRERIEKHIWTFYPDKDLVEAFLQ